MFDSTGKALEKFNSDRTTLTIYGGAIIMQFWVRVIKGIWKSKNWKFIFHIVDAQGPVLLK